MTVKERKAREKLNRINEIQAAAKVLISLKGYRESTMEEIARKAEVSKGTVYSYFKSKDELYVSLMIPVVEELSRLLTKFEKQLRHRGYQECQDFLNGLFQLYIELRHYDPEGMRIFQNFQLNFLYSVMPPGTRKRLREIGKRNFATLRRIISNANKLGLLRDADPLKLADVLWGLFLGWTKLRAANFNSQERII